MPVASQTQAFPVFFLPCLFRGPGRDVECASWSPKLGLHPPAGPEGLCSKGTGLLPLPTKSSFPGKVSRTPCPQDWEGSTFSAQTRAFPFLTARHARLPALRMQGPVSQALGRGCPDTLFASRQDRHGQVQVGPGSGCCGHGAQLAAHVCGALGTLFGLTPPSMAGRSQAPLGGRVGLQAGAPCADTCCYPYFHMVILTLKRYVSFLLELPGL